MKCPSCGGNSQTLEARLGKGDLGRSAYVRRRRRCKGCGHRFTTSEVIIEEKTTADLMIVRSSTMEQLLRLIAAAFSPDGNNRASEIIDEIIGKAGRRRS